MKNNLAIILSGGIGSRFGGEIPKQYIKAKDKPIIMYCLEKFFYDELIDKIIIVAAKEWFPFIKDLIAKFNSRKEIILTYSGESRQLSIYNGLKIARNLCDDNDVIIIHDAARPLVTETLINKCVKECMKFDGVLPALPVKDTLYLSKEGKTVDGLFNRDKVISGQSPEAFKFGKYYSIHNELDLKEISEIKGSSEIAYKMGLKIKIIKGEESNFKITTKEDLELLNILLKKNY